MAPNGAFSKVLCLGEGSRFWTEEATAGRAPQLGVRAQLTAARSLGCPRLLLRAASSGQAFSLWCLRNLLLVCCAVVGNNSCWVAIAVSEGDTQHFMFSITTTPGGTCILIAISGGKSSVACPRSRPGHGGARHAPGPLVLCCTQVHGREFPGPGAPKPDQARGEHRDTRPGLEPPPSTEASSAAVPHLPGDGRGRGKMGTSCKVAMETVLSHFVFLVKTPMKGKGGGEGGKL